MTISAASRARVNWEERPHLSSKKPSLPATVTAIRIVSFQLYSVAGKPTSKCFVSPRYGHRYSDFDSRLPADQPRADPCSASVIVLSRSLTPVEAAVISLGVNTHASWDAATFGRLLVEHRHVAPLPQIEEVIEIAERCEEMGVPVDGASGCLCFTETGNPKDPVAVVCFRRADHRWWPDLRALADETPLNCSVFVPNLDSARW